MQGLQNTEHVTTAVFSAPSAAPPPAYETILRLLTRFERMPVASPR